MTKQAIHTRIESALGSVGARFGPLTEVPLRVDIPSLIPLAIWAFTLTNPPGGRHPSESKIQIMVPGQSRSERGDFVAPDQRFKILMGVHPTEDTFVLWDAYRQQNFPWSKNVQVRGPIIWDAQIMGLGEGARRLTTGDETVFACRSDRLVEALRERIQR